MSGFMKHLRITPTSPNKTPGGLDMWFRVFHSQAMMHKCKDLLVTEDETSPHHHPDIVASDDEHDPVEGDANCQRRLACLLWA